MNNFSQETTFQQDKKKFLTAISIAAGILGFMWLVFLVEWLMGADFGNMGVYPRKFYGLHGILTSPFVHADFKHLLSNSAPFLVLLASIIFFFRKIAFRAVFWIYLMTGLWVWVGARSSWHIGASGVVYGMAAFMFFSGIFRRDRRSLVISVITAFLYGSMVWGIFPQVGNNVSWESHLFGAVAGIAVAFALRKIDRAPKKKYSWEDEPESAPTDQYAIWNYRDQQVPPRVHPEDEPADKTSKRDYFY